MRRLLHGVSGLMSGLPSRPHRHVSEISRAQLTGVVEVIYMDSPDRVDWRKLSVAARPTLQRCDGSQGARHAGRPVEVSRTSKRRCVECWPGRCPKALDCYFSMTLFLRLHVKLNDRDRGGDARRVLAPLRPVGTMQGRHAASGLLNFWRLFLSGDISVHYHPPVWPSINRRWRGSRQRPSRMA